MPYETDFFAAIRDGSARSAEIVLPPVLDAVKPSSVVDFGCGTGEWLKVCRRYGVDDVLGYDGYNEDPDFPIVRMDLTDLILTDPVDMTMCLEVGEHLPESAANTLVRNLSCAPVVLFSAAIPGQTGHHHINEQWPDYWYEKFAALGYECLDLRTVELWNDERVEWWYRQNLLLFFKGDPPPFRSAHAIGVPAKFVHPHCPRAKTRLRVTMDVDLATNQAVVVESRLI